MTKFEYVKEGLEKEAARGDFLLKALNTALRGNKTQRRLGKGIHDKYQQAGFSPFDAAKQDMKGVAAKDLIQTLAEDLRGVKNLNNTKAVKKLKAPTWHTPPPVIAPPTATPTAPITTPISTPTPTTPLTPTIPPTAPTLSLDNLKSFLNKGRQTLNESPRLSATGLGTALMPYYLDKKPKKEEETPTFDQISV